MTVPSGSVVVPAVPARARPRPAAHRRRRAARGSRLISLLSLGLLSVVVCLGVAVVAMRLSGHWPVVIMSGSMTPTLNVGDVVLSRSAQPLSVRPGDLVTFHDPNLHGELVTHRVLSITPGVGIVGFETKGDANTVAESWWVPTDGSVGLVVTRLPYVGWWFGLLGTGVGRVSVIAVLCLWVAGGVLRRRHRTSSRPR